MQDGSEDHVLILSSDIQSEKQATASGLSQGPTGDAAMRLKLRR